MEGKNLSERVSTVTAEELEQTAWRKSAHFPTNYTNPADCLIRSIETLCAPVAHSKKATGNAREKYFALWHYFG